VAQPSESTIAQPFEEALLNAANALFSQTTGGAKLFVIDPFIDGVSAMQSIATRSMASRIGELVRTQYPQFDLQPFSAANVRKSPTVLIGTFTPVNANGATGGVREAYRICLALADLQSGTLIAKSIARAQMAGVNHTPTPYYQESPAWMKETASEAYISACQATNPGEAIPAEYRHDLLAATAVSEAIAAYDAGRYREALDRYNSALESSAGVQLRVYNGLYLTNLKLNRNGAASEAFNKIIDHGLRKNRLAIKFHFRPGTTAFTPEKQISGAYPTWLNQIAKRAAQGNGCLEVTGHTSRSGSEPLNERLSLLRAEFVKNRLIAEAPPLAKRAVARGVGSRENLVGTGKDDLSDALDRRVSFQVVSCSDGNKFY
jgi:outer membrane protein OmpA-like peptidoglycan-associated protein